MKLISDKKDGDKLYARLAIGFLLVQDVVATTILIFVSTLSGGGDLLTTIIITILKGATVTLLLLFVSTKILPKLSSFFAASPEYLFLFSVSWGLGLAVLFKYLGFSIEIGALLAGAALSASPYAQEIGYKMRPLRDFFIIAFFILLGATLQLDSLSTLLVPALMLSLYVLIGNPLIMIVLTGVLGFNKKTSFMAGLAVAQVSEFSLILIILAKSTGHVDAGAVSLVTLVGLITIAASSYMITYSEKIYPLFAKYLSIFERKRTRPENDTFNNYDVVLFGCNRVGYDFIRVFKNLHTNFLAVDFDPEVVKQVSKYGVNCV
jgi:Kef-type K+ transport system membrane component KefB